MDVEPVRTWHRVASPEVSAKQLVGTIQQVETHDQDPTSATGPGDEAEPDPWDEVATEFGDLKDRLTDTYRKVADEHGPTEAEIKQALSTLAGAWDQVAESVTTALQDPDVREKLMTAASSFASAFGNTISEFGAELRNGSNARSEEDEV